MSGTRRIGSYQLLQPLGRGGMASVWRARHRSRPDDVALKLFAPSEGDRDRRMVDEIRALASLRHPHILWIHDHGVVDEADAERTPDLLRAGQRYLVTERAQGDLRPYVGKLDWMQLRDVLLQLLDALAFAHARGLVHRDLKPANVLVGGGRVGIKLADFGLADLPEARSGVAQRLKAAGTAAFMAPEQCLDAWRDFGPWTDLYGLGCVAWRLAAGHGPYSRRPFREMLDAQLGEELPPFRPAVAVPVDFEAWLRALLQKSIAGRPGRAADVARSLQQLGLATPAASRPVPTPAAEPTELLHSAPTMVLPAAGDSAAAPASVQRAPSSQPWARRWQVSPPSWPWSADSLDVLREVSLVGRSVQQQALWDLLGEVHGGSGARAVVITGGVGAGTSALAQWLVRRAHELGMADTLSAVFDAMHAPGEGLRHVVRADLGIGGMAPGEARARVAVRVAAEDVALLEAVLWPTDPEQASTSTAGNRALLARWVCRPRPRPLVLWLDDVDHDLDAVALVEEVLAAQQTAPVLMVLTSSGTPAAVAAATLHALTQHASVEALSLAPLSEGRVRAPAWEARLRAVLVTERQREAADLAATLGRQVRSATWRAACALADADPSIEPVLLLAGLAQPWPQGDGWSLAHPALRRALLRQAEKAGRSSRHHALCAQVVSSPERRAVHLLASGAAQEAAEVWLSLNAKAASLEQVARWLHLTDRALSLAGVPSTDRLHVLQGQRRTLWHYRRGERREATFEATRARARCRAHGHDDLLAESLRLEARCLADAGDPQRRLEVLQRAVEAAEAAGQEHLAALLLLDRASVLQKLRRLGEARALFEEAIARSEAVGQPVAVAYRYLGGLVGELGEHDASDRYLARAAEIAQENRDARGGWFIRNATAITLAMRGDSAEAARRLGELATEGVRLGLRGSAAVTLRNQAHCWLDAGEPDRAARSARAAEQLATRTGRFGTARVARSIHRLLAPRETFSFGEVLSGLSEDDARGSTPVAADLLAAIADNLAAMKQEDAARQVLRGATWVAARAGSPQDIEAVAARWRDLGWAAEFLG